MFDFDWLGGLKRRGRVPVREPRYYPDADAIYRRLRLMERRLDSFDLSIQRASREAHAARQAVSNSQRSPSGESQPGPKAERIKVKRFTPDMAVPGGQNGR